LWKLEAVLKPNFLEFWPSAGRCCDQRTASKDFNSQLQKSNAARSKVRCRVEHVSAHQKNIMGLFIRTIGIERARIKIAMTNIAYAPNGLDRETIYLGIADEKTKPRKKSKD